jgi:hypothetical protein
MLDPDPHYHFGSKTLKIKITYEIKSESFKFTLTSLKQFPSSFSVKKTVEASPSPAAAKGAAAKANAPAVNNTATSSDLLGLAVDSQHQQQSLGIY